MSHVEVQKPNEVFTNIYEGRNFKENLQVYQITDETQTNNATPGKSQPGSNSNEEGNLHSHEFRNGTSLPDRVLRHIQHIRSTIIYNTNIKIHVNP